MGYIRMDKDLEDDPRVLRLTDVLLEVWSEQGVPADSIELFRSAACDAVIGALYRLWRHADTHLKRHDRLDTASHALAVVTGIPLRVLRAFPRDWFIEHPDGQIELPGYTDKNVLLVKEERRANGRERTRRWRQRKAQGQLNGSASHASRGDIDQRHATVTTGTGTGPGTETGTSETGTGPVDRSDSLASPASPLARREPLNLDPAPCEPSTPQGWERGAAAAREAARGKPTPPDEIERRRQAAASFAERHGAEAKP